MQTQKLHYKDLIKEILILTVAVTIIAAAIFFFLVPSHTSISSISGLGIVLSNFIPLPLSAITMILNVMLLIIGFLTCGKEFGAKTVYTSILLPLLLDKREPDEEYLALLTRQLGLTALLQRQPTQLSGGQQQRAAIARALITRPAVVLADEPTGNLDHQNSVEVFRLLREVAAQQHQTVVYVTHDQGLAAQADRVLRMQDGRIEEA